MVQGNGCFETYGVIYLGRPGNREGGWFAGLGNTDKAGGGVKKRTSEKSQENVS